jgi:glycosyltransferase involved in cell wall biosynthesis
MHKIISVCWRPHNRRAESLARDINSTLFLAPNILTRKVYAPIRYIFLIFWTIIICLKNRPDIIIETVPPPFCSTVVSIYAIIFRCKYIVDANHSAATGFWSKIPFGFWLNKKIMNNALITLVHNEPTKKLTDAKGLKSIVLEDKIPQLTSTEQTILSSDFTILIPCSFDPDEPIIEIYKAAHHLSDIKFFITGNLKRLKNKYRKSQPSNVVLTGFLSDEKYDMLLNSVDAVLVLSTDDYPVRPRGAGEAIAAGKPLIVSRNHATQHHFYKGTALIDNNSRGIVEAILNIQRNYEKYSIEIRQLKYERITQYNHELLILKNMINYELSQSR